MNWEAIGASAEAISVVAILISLVYVATQIRQNTQLISRNIDATRLAAFERNIESGNRVRELLIVNPDLGQLFVKGLQSYRGLDDVEKLRFGLLLRNMFSSLQGAYIRQLSVAHDPLEFEGSARVVDSILTTPGGREWLEATEVDWRPEFEQFVHQRLAEILKSADQASG